MCKVRARTELLLPQRALRDEYRDIVHIVQVLKMPRFEALNGMKLKVWARNGEGESDRHDLTNPQDSQYHRCGQ